MAGPVCASPGPNSTLFLGSRIFPKLNCNILEGKVIPILYTVPKPTPQTDSIGIAGAQRILKSEV